MHVCCQICFAPFPANFHIQVAIETVTSVETSPIGVMALDVPGYVRVSTANPIYGLVEGVKQDNDKFGGFHLLQFFKSVLTS